MLTAGGSGFDRPFLASVARPMTPAASLGFVAMLTSVMRGSGLWRRLPVAMRVGEVSVVTPFRYSRLLFALILGITVFGERNRIMMTLAGSALVIVLKRGGFVATPRAGAKVSPAAGKLRRDVSGADQNAGDKGLCPRSGCALTPGYLRQEEKPVGQAFRLEDRLAQHRGDDPGGERNKDGSPGSVPPHHQGPRSPSMRQSPAPV